MLDLWAKMTELSYRGFGKKKRKFPKEPKNFKTWSKESQERWIISTQERMTQKEQWDMNFIVNYSKYMSKKQVNNMVELYQQLFGGGLNKWMKIKHII